jgi:hypothetical protein
VLVAQPLVDRRAAVTPAASHGLGGRRRSRGGRRPDVVEAVTKDWVNTNAKISPRTDSATAIADPTPEPDDHGGNAEASADETDEDARLVQERQR